MACGGAIRSGDMYCTFRPAYYLTRMSWPSEWVSLVAGLSGAVIGGLISLLAQWISFRHQSTSQKRAWQEERERWRIEDRLTDLREMYDSVESLSIAVENFRIRKAHERSTAEADREIPAHVLPYNDARGGFEDSIWAVKRSLLLMDESLLDWSKKFDENYRNWLLAKTEDDGIEALLEFERQITEFRRFVAAEFRKAKTERASLTSV